MRGNAFQLVEKYSTLANDAASNDDKVLSEAYLQFADHYYRLNKEIELLAEAKNNYNSENIKNSSSNHESTENEESKKIDETDNFTSKPSRKERSFRAKVEEEKEKKPNNKENLPKKFTQKANT